MLSLSWHVLQTSNTTFSRQNTKPSLNIHTTSLATTPPDQITLRKSQGSPKFGCRMFGFISAQPDREQGELLYHLVNDGENSMMTQSQIEPDHPVAPHNWEYFFAHSQWPNNGYRITGMQNEGCGQVRFDEKIGVTGQRQLRPSLYKSAKGFSEESFIQNALRKIRKQPPPAWILQLREASSVTKTPEIKLENSHPFRLGHFIFMHNGTVSADAVAWLEEQNQRYHEKYPTEIPMPQGTTDSEKIFLYMMGCLQEKYGTTDSEQLETVQLEQVFQETLQKLDRLNNQPGSHLKMYLNPDFQKNSGLDVKDSNFRFEFGLNFCLTDGKRLLLSRQHRSLHFATVKDPQGNAKAALFATYPPQPSAKSGIAPLEWWEIPEGHMVTIEPHENGAPLSFKMNPFTMDAS